MDSFVHLQVQSAFSFLWGTFTPEELVTRVKALGQTAVALTDLGMWGLVRFYKSALKEGIQPIAGGRVHLENGEGITLLVKTREGYGNLCRLMTLSHGNGLLPEEAITLAELKTLSKGLICLAGGNGSRLSSLSERGSNDWAGNWLDELKSAFPGREDLFVALENDSGDQHPALRLNALAQQKGLPVAAVNGVVYLSPEDETVHRALVAIQQRHHHRLVAPVPGGNHYLASGPEMGRRLPVPESLANTRRIADLCRGFTLPLGECHPPCFRDPREAARELGTHCRQSLVRRFNPIPRPYIQRLEKELQMVADRHLGDYFLLVRDITAFAREKDIRFSVRGSAAGSLMVHLTLGGVDPVKNGLLFERFINEGRGDLPDVDLDFDSLRRNEVVGYILETYPEQTAMVSTIHTMKLRAAVRLTAKALGYSSSEIHRLTQCLPLTTRGLGLPEALESLPELKASDLKRETRLVETAERLRRLPFQASVHLGGILVTPGNITDWTPLARSPKGYSVAQLDKDDVEALGLLKLDILGLRMHTAVRKAREVLAAQGIDFDPDRIPPNDPRTYEMLRHTKTMGVFQIESPGQRQLLGRLQPRSFSDLIAEISLFRPGPVEGNLVTPFVDQKNGKKKPDYPHPDLTPILEDTYGLILFQEQVLSIVHVFAGLSYGEADRFRRVMTKDRGKQRMQRLRDRFVAGAVGLGRDRALAEDVWRRIMALAAYGFCKAHAASFAHITYQSAFLKAHYPLAFFLGILNAGQVGTYPPVVLLNEARRHGVPVLPPHVNQSGTIYSAENNAIRVPLIVIKGVGHSFAKRIASERDRGGEFQSREALRFRVPLPDSVFRQLGQTGALDGLDSASGWLFEDMAHA